MTSNGKVVAVTGSSSGIGYETALAFARNGYTTYATMRNLQKGSDLSTISKKEDLPIEIIELDVISDDSVKNAIEKISSKSNRIDILVNNAGFVLGGAFEDFRMEEIKSQFETNFFGVIRVTQAVIPHMRKQGSGRIVNVSSIAGRWGIPFSAIYASTKFALEGLTESISYELEPFGIKTILVEPGVIKTDIFKSAVFSKNFSNSDSPYYENVQNTINQFDKLMKDATSPQEVAKIIFDVSTSKEKPQLRYPAGSDAEQGLRNRKELSDEEFFNTIRQMLKMS